MKRDAAWLLRRFRDQAAPDWQVRQVLEREFNRIIEVHSAMRSDMDELRRSAPNRLRDFDAASDRALQSMGENNFDLALREIRKAGIELAELCQFVAVAAELDQASRSVGQVEALLDSGLTGLTTPSVLRKLRDLARQFLDHGEVRKAKFVVLLLKSQADRLRARNSRESLSRMTFMLDELTSIGGAEAVDALRRLAGEGYLYLVEKLAEDLDSILAVRYRNRRASEMAGGALGHLIEDLAETRRCADAASCFLAHWLGGAATTDVA